MSNRQFLAFGLILALPACQTTTSPAIQSSPPASALPNPAEMTCKQLLAERKLLQQEIALFGASPYQTAAPATNMPYRMGTTPSVTTSYAQGYAVGAQIRQDRAAANARARFSALAQAIVAKACI